MSFRPDKLLHQTGNDFSAYSRPEMETLFQQELHKGLHGLCFSLYVDGQNPGDVISENQVRRRMEIISPHTKWIRSFSCIDGNEHIPILAHEFRLQTLVGAWIGEDRHLNELEIEGLISLAKKGKVDIAAVGNEVLYRGDMEEEELLEYISRVKAALPSIPVGYVDAYYEFRDRPKIANACDVILANCYPFWEGCLNEYSILYMKQMYHQAVQAAQGKRVIITETGWPSAGANLRAAEPSPENAMKYFINAQQWARTEQIEMFYFSSFDESWKTDDEGEVGANWGLWDRSENLKYIHC
ncbi:MAG: glycosyl hydrolase [Saprospiraceae bacterium]|nr:glycosyl hydrolase [Saprospiraceae bacterium]